MKLLVLTTRLFGQPASGGELCTARLLAELRALGHQLQVVGRGEPPPDEAGLRWTSLGPLVGALADLPRRARWAALVAALLRHRALTVERQCAGGALRRARGLVDAALLAQVDAIVVDHLQALAWLPPAAAMPPRPILLVMHNVESAGYGPTGRRAADIVLAREARLLRALEDAGLRRATAVACLSDDDAAVFRARTAALALACAVEVLPGYALSPPVLPERRDRGPRRIGLIGTWTWAANRRALRWVLDHVRPQLPASCELVLAGAGLDELESLPGVVKLGRVADTRAFYAGVDVLAIAALDGTGVQEKAIEAFGTGLPVVATGLALRGLHPLPAGVSVADDAAAFARACAAGKGAPALASIEVWNHDRRQRYRAALERCLAPVQAGG